MSPGPVHTPAYERGGVARDDPGPVIATIPAGRLGTAEDIAQAACFLLLEQSMWINGANLVADGGQTAIV